MSQAPEFSHELGIDRIGCHELYRTLAATPQECAAIATRLKLEGVAALTAEFRVRCGVLSGLFEVVGEARAEVTQTCVVSGKPFPAAVTAKINALFSDGAPQEDEIPGYDDWDDVEEITPDQTIDLGELAVQHVSLALDPYPKKPGAKWPERDDAAEKPPSPFAVLKVLKGGD